MNVGDPIGPSCHTGSRTCWFSEVSLENSKNRRSAEFSSSPASHYAPQTTLYRLENTIEERRQEAAHKTGSVRLTLLV